MIAEFVQSAYYRFSDAHIAPAYFAALLALLLAGLILAVDQRRPASRLWAVVMILTALWMSGIGMSQLYKKLLFLRCAAFDGCILLWTVALLYEAIITPWASPRKLFVRVKKYVWLPMVGLIAFTQWYLPDASTDTHRIRLPIFWGLEIMAFAWDVWLLVRAWRVIGSAETPPRVREELRGFMLFVFLGSAFVLMVNFGANLMNSRYPGWFSPISVIGAIIAAGIGLARRGTLASRHTRRSATLFLMGTVIYGLIAMATIACVRAAAPLGLDAKIFLGGLLALALAMHPAASRAFKAWLDRRYFPKPVLIAQNAVRKLAESCADMGTLHEGYRDILRAWSGGAEQVFLSEGSFAARWPTDAIPVRILNLAANVGSVTPEGLEDLGAVWAEEFQYLVRHQIGAVVCAASEVGAQLVVAVSARTVEGPFSSMELIEARELLAAMLTGAHLVRMRQRLRGNDRLNFYARYAPQFAHELRNGLYLQTQLMRAIAAGRASDVRPADAAAGLERTEQIDRLCDHFFNVGTLFNRPIVRVNLRSWLPETIERMRRQFDGGGDIVLRMGVDTDEQAQVFANAELLGMALMNLVKNAFEAAPSRSGGATVEIVLSRHLDKIHLLVRDTGPGLPLDRIAEPFAPGRSHKREGMGLGLSIVRDCVEAVGGTVGLRFTGLEGTCFEITLSCAARMDGAAAPCEFLTETGAA